MKKFIAFIAIFGVIMHAGAMTKTKINIPDQKIHIQAGKVGSKSGVSTPISLGKTVSKASLSYDLMMEDNFDCKLRNGKKLTGKFPGLSGGRKPNTGGIPDYKDLNRGWSVRPIYRGYGCKLMLYIYDMDMPPPSRPGKDTFGKNERLNIKSISLKPGQSYRIKLEVIVNDIGKDNGIARLWVDNELAAEYSDITYRMNYPGNGAIDTVRYSVFNGGGKKFKLEKDTSISIRNVVVDY
ncbi:MAG: hypothetical protein GY828_01645 [Candidatus Gracilibacteria bacterium]|nr:hypothetical protein [Candidatus Gracilibacteria bacterium]